MMKFLRWLRLLIAGGMLLGMTALFVTPIGRLVRLVGWLPDTQFLPALLTGSLMTLVIAVLTILFGRVYCSVACPLGIAQDLFRYVFTFGFLRKKRSVQKRKFSDRTSWLVRSAFLLVFVVLVVCGMTAYLDPYGIFSRTATLVREILGGIMPGHRIVGRIALKLHICAEAMLPLGVSLSIALLAAIIFGATLFRARWWCNTVCPVGTLLGLVSRRSLFRVRIKPDKCVGCGLCARACAAGAITPGHPAKVDNSRCIDCLNCADVCRREALKWH